MLQNYLKIAIRSLVKQRLYSFINILGLAIGLACTVLISLWVRDEVSYDRFFADADDMYRLNWDFNWNNNEGIGAGTPPPLAVSLLQEIPEVKAVTRLYAVSNMTVRYEDKFFNESHIVSADSTFFDLFNFPLLSGNPATALKAPNRVILTEATARKYFGDEPALGKTLLIGKDKTDFSGQYTSAFEVTGVLKDIPHRSHLQFDLLTSMTSHPEVKKFDWSWVWMQVATYTKLKPGASMAAVQAKIPAMIKKSGQAGLARVGLSFDEIITKGGRWNFVLQPLTNVYLDSVGIGNRVGPIGNQAYVYLFGVIAVFVLFLACINFMNLATARSANRAREVGVRKTLGSDKRALVRQFLTESMVYSLLALPLALIIAKLALPSFNQLAGKTLHLNLINPWWLSLALLGLTLLVGFIAGSYPSFYLSSFRPVQVLKGGIQNNGGKNHRLRNALVVFQFTITIALIASTLLVQQQMNYLRGADMGFNKEGIVLISNENHPLGNREATFKEQLKNDTRIGNASISTGVPPYDGFQDAYFGEGRGEEQFSLISYTTDEDFIPTMDIQVLQGRGFSKAFSEKNSVILNEAAAELFGWDDPIGKKITYPGTSGERDFQVVGVVKDFNFLSLYSPVTPFALFHEDARSYTIPNSYIITRLASNNVQAQLQLLETQWKTFAPDTPFEYEFQDESFELQYLAEQRMGTIFFVFSILTIFIACIGLLGLVAFSVEQRSKEIGIRKILGARVSSILLLLSKDFVLLIGIAFVIAVPLAWWSMNRWLQDFAYRIDIQWWMFGLAGLAALGIALLTVSFQAIRAAVANPVESLRSE